MILPFADSTNKKIDLILKSPNRVYLLYGEAFIGKYFTSRYIASQLLQDDSITSYSYVHPALYVVSSDANDKAISISSIRTLIESIWHTNYSDIHQKVVIIRNIDNITESAANALLKNLEDMPNETTIILTANNLDAVMPTIRSRSQLVYCRADEQRSIEHLVENYNLNNKQAQEYMEMANHRSYKAVKNLDELSYERSKYLNTITTQFAEGSITARFAIAKQVHEKKMGQEFLSELIYATSKQSSILDDRLDFVENIVRALDQLRNNVNTRMVLENLALR